MKLLAIVAGAALLLFGSVFILITVLSPVIDKPIDRFSLGMFGVFMVAGAALIELGSRGTWARAIAATVRLLTTPSTLMYPAAHAIVLFLLALITVRAFMREPTVPVFGAVMIYAIASPILIALRPGWWLNAITSVIGMVLMFTALPMAIEAIAGRSLGESSMILLFPMMFYPVALVLSGIARLVIARRPVRS